MTYHFSLPSTAGTNLSLSDFKGKNSVVVYFYPKDCTSGCTREGQDFKHYFKEFSRLNTVILGISRDKLALHHKFKTEHDFPFELLSDETQTACDNFKVIKEKSLYGKKYWGIDRSTFLFDKKGQLVREWRNVKVDGHVADVLAAVKAL